MRLIVLLITLQVNRCDLSPLVDPVARSIIAYHLERKLRDLHDLLLTPWEFRGVLLICTWLRRINLADLIGL